MPSYEKMVADLRRIADSTCSDLDNMGKLDILPQDDLQIKVKEFRKLLVDILQPHHDDQFLLRWLKARDYDLVKAERMVRESFKFRKKIGADTILTNFEVPLVYKKYTVTQCLGVDNERSVVRLFMAGLCDYKGYVYSIAVIDIMKLLVYVLESDLKLQREKKPDEKITFILDFTGFTLKQFNDKSIINVGIQLLTMYQDNYPELLKSAYLINVPSYFNWFFSIFKPFLNAVTLSKIKIYKTDEWKQDLCNIMDPKLLPAFLGGDLTDPDGNPKCNKLFNWDPKIDVSFYLKKNQEVVEDPTMKTAVVNQRSTFQIPVDVKEKGMILKWSFKTKDNNIRFGLYFKKSNKSLQEILPVENVDCQVFPEENQYYCEKAGTYVLHFDNTYSWLTAKQLSYKVEVVSTNVIEANNN